MNEQQQAHILKLLNDFNDQAYKKYEQGAIEHGGNLWDLSEDRLIDELIGEAIDHVIYLLTLKEKRSGKV